MLYASPGRSVRSRNFNGLHLQIFLLGRFDAKPILRTSTNPKSLRIERALSVLLLSAEITERTVKCSWDSASDHRIDAGPFPKIFFTSIGSASEDYKRAGRAKSDESSAGMFGIPCGVKYRRCVTFNRSSPGE